MEIDDYEIVELELKYCEYCGGLWLRRKGDGEVYCASCLPYVAEFPVAERRPSRPRLPGDRDILATADDGGVFLCAGWGRA